MHSSLFVFFGIEWAMVMEYSWIRELQDGEGSSHNQFQGKVKLSLCLSKHYTMKTWDMWERMYKYVFS
jgi:hypothetical protein